MHRSFRPANTRDLIEALTHFRADDVNRHVARQHRHLRHPRRHIVGNVGFREQHYGRGAALARQEQIPLETPQAEVGIERHDDEDDVDIGGDDLFVGHLPGHAA